MRKYLYPLLTVLVIVGLYYAEQYASKQSEAYPDTSGESVKSSSEEFSANLLPTSTTGVVVNHSYYTLSYVEKHEQAEWVAYPLLKEHLSRQDFERPDFVEDRKVKSKSAHWRSYKGSGYDRGHLCPAGDRRFSFEAYHETFLTSNISPQNNDFNGGIWNKLEQQTRYWAKKYDGVYVVTGGVLKEGLPTIGIERVSVPEQFYKIILDKYKGNYKVIAFLIPNRETNDSFYDYVTSVDAIEAETGLDFFSSLPDTIENNLEASMDSRAWGKR
jgi:endonuclease G